MDAEKVLELMHLLHCSLYVVVHTKYTTHHFERLMASCKDRGSFKWIAESKAEMWENQDKDDEARRSHIDHADMFPRFYFLLESMVAEFFKWLQARNLEVTHIEVPKI